MAASLREDKNFKRTFFPAPPRATGYHPQRPRGRLAGREPLVQLAAKAAAKAAKRRRSMVQTSGTVVAMGQD